MATIGYATLQIIPSLDGVSDAIDKQLGGKLRDTGKRGGQQLAKGVGDGLKGLQQDVDSTARAYQKLYDKAADALGKVRTEEASLKRLRDTGASDDRIVRAEERLATARRNNARAVREAEEGHRSLTAAQAALANGSSNLGSNLSGLAGIAARVGPALSTAGAVAGGVAVAGLAALAAGAVTATAELYQLGAQFDETFDNLRIKTGATGPQLKALEDATKRISTGVPLAIGDIGNVVGETSRALHLTGTDLDNVAKNIANLGRLTGENVDVRTLGKAFRGFGVDAKDQVPALNSLFQASQATGVGVNELLATVVKGGAGLRQFGFDFGQSAALATQFEQAGLDSDKAMTGLTKGLAALAKNGQTGQQALKDNVTQIKNLIAAGNDAEALDLTNKLFGAKGGVQFFEAIRNGALDLDTLASSLDGTGDSIQSAADDTDDFEQKWQELKNTLAVALQPLATGLFDSVNTNLTGLADAVTEHQPQIIGFFKGLGDIVITSAEHVARGTGGILQAIGDIVGGLGNIEGTVLKFESFQARLRGDDSLADELHRQSEEAFGWGESIRAMGDKLANLHLDDARAKMHGWAAEAQNAATAALNAHGRVATLGDALGALPTAKNIAVNVNVDPAHAQQVIDDFFRLNANRTLPVAVNPNIPATIPGTNPLNVITPGRASGGAVFGAGTATSDSIPGWLSNGEHVLTAEDVAAMGGQAGVYAFRNALHRNVGGPIPLRDPRGVDPHGGSDAGPSLGPFAPWWNTDWMPPEHPEKVSGDLPGDQGGWWWHHGPTLPIGGIGAGIGRWFPPIGKLRKPRPGEQIPPDMMPPGVGFIPWGFAGGGAVGPDVLAASALMGTAYSQANRTDCSGMVARVIDRALGMPESGLMSTQNAQEWLAARGFVPGVGGPGQISVGWYNHGPNPNDGHMAMTLSDGSSAEAGGGVGDIFQIGGGAAGASDPQFDQHMYLPTLYGEGRAGPASAPSVPSSPFAGGSAVAAMMQAPPAGDGGATSTPSSGGGFGGLQLPSSLSGFGSFAGGKLGDLAKLGEAAGSIIDGQVASALDVFGIPDSPSWLKGISQLIGGIKIGGGDGASLPLAAGSNGMGTPPPDDPGNMHGTRAGQRPGGVTYNITARDTEDAFIKAQRLEREKAAAKLDRF